VREYMLIDKVENEISWIISDVSIVDDYCCFFYDSEKL
jgi:hypothetical protein